MTLDENWSKVCVIVSFRVTFAFGEVCSMLVYRIFTIRKSLHSLAFLICSNR